MDAELCQWIISFLLILVESPVAAVVLQHVGIQLESVQYQVWRLFSSNYPVHHEEQ